MDSFLQAVRSNMVVQSVLCAALGAFLVFWPEATTLTVVYLLAAYLALSGAASLFAYFRSKGQRSGAASVLASGVLLLVVALVMVLFPQVIAGFLSLVLGIVLVVGGVVNVVRSIEMRAYSGSAWIVALVVSAALAIGGVVIVVNPFGTTVMFVLVLGVLLLAKGIADLALELWMSHMEKQLP